MNFDIGEIMKLVWCSDIHLNFVKDKREYFYADIKNRCPDVVVISGDIAESHDVVEYITEMERFLEVPVYFVLGNHDFYGSSVTDVRSSVKHLHHLAQTSIVALSKNTALIGVDAWTGDCRNGDYEKGMDTLKKTLQKLADTDARLLARRVKNAIKRGYTRLILVTHVPPYENACLYAGKKSSPDGLCFWSSRILGETIEPLAKANPNIDFLWLCGHTHSKVTLHVCKNMQVRVAGAEYYYPQVNGETEYD